MYPAPFEYHKPSSLREALDLVRSLQGEVRLLAGGHSLIPSMKLRLSQPDHLVDLAAIENLREISVAGKELTIGAMVTHRDVESSPLVAAKLPYLCKVAGGIGDPQVRNRGTLGGSLANADSAADYPASLLALDGVIEAIGPNGTRNIRSDAWSIGLLSTALQQDEILVRVRFPLLGELSGAAYVKVPHPASRFAVVGVAVRIRLDMAGTCVDCRIAITGVGDIPQRAIDSEATMIGEPISDARIGVAAGVLAREVTIIRDGLLSEEAKRQLCQMTARKVLKQAAAAAAIRT